MSIVTSEKIYKRCLNEDWAVGGFIGYDMEIMQASAEAAMAVNAACDDTEFLQSN